MIGLGAAAAVVGCVVGGVLTVIHSRPRHPVATWAGAPERAGPPVTIDRVLDRVRITYRVDTGNPLGAARSTTVVSLNRPFESRTVTTNDRDHGRLQSDQTAALGRHVVRSADGQPPPQVLAGSADLASGDVRLDLALEQLVADGRLVRRERRTVLGRPCQVYRSSGPLAGASLNRPAGADTTDSCVDGAGLVLAEVQRSGSVVTRRQIATRVDDNPTFPKDFFAAPDPTVPTSQGGAAFVRVDPKTGPSERAFALDTPPAGFTFLGRFADVSAAVSDRQGNQTGTRRAGFTDVYLRGRDVVILDQGAVNLGQAPFSTDPFGQPMDLGPLGKGEAIAGPRLQVVRALPAGGSGSDYVRVAGTIPVDQLAVIARSLRVVPAPSQ